MKKLAIIIAGIFLNCWVPAKINAQNTPTSANIPPGTAATFILPAAFNTTPNSTPAAYNFTRVWVPTVPIADENSAKFALDGAITIPVSTSYTDGFGREIMTISHGPDNSHKDLISPIDNRASLSKYDFLPYAQSHAYPRFSNNLSPFIQDVGYYYTSFIPEKRTGLSETITSFPSGVPTKTTYAPGLSFIGQGRGTTVTAGFNVANDVINFSFDGTTIAGFGTYYAANTLVTKTTTSANGSVAVEYRNDDNQLICKKVCSYHSGLTYKWLSTYYVYDDFGRIVCIITPNAATYSVASPTMMSYCYTFKYGKYGNVVERTVPGKSGIESTVYDKKNRPVLFQSPLLATTGQWQFNIYDSRNHVVMTGLLSDTHNRSTWQDWVYGGTTVIPPSSVTQLLNYFLNDFAGSYPSAITSCDVRTYNYYDDYSDPSISGRVFDNSYSSDYLRYPGMIMPMPYMFTQGMLTASRTKVVDPAGAGGFANSWITSVYFYDQKEQLIQTQTLNPWNTSSSNWDISTFQYNFKGQMVQNIAHHYSFSTCAKSDTKVLKRYVYDSYYGRLTMVQQQIDDGSLRNIATYTYDDLGKVTGKNLGGVEQQDYTYNIRGQLTSINKDVLVAPVPDKTFGIKLSYDYGFSEPRYDGAISGIVWQGAGTVPLGSYGYEYDLAGRLTNANYNQAVYGGWNKAALDYSMSNVNYDNNGNILSMYQRGTTSTGPVDMDKLTYSYSTGNQLYSVQDTVTVDYGLGDFHDVTGTGPDYTYDADGNLASDRNKGITNITYNEHDLPLSVTFSNGSSITNIYDASGNLLWKQVQNTVIPKTDIHRYWGAFNYLNDDLDFILHDEGRARWLADSSIFKYDFFVKDHLGNVRTVLTSDETNAADYFADHELAAAGLESSMFANLDAVRDYKPGAPNPYDQEAAHLDGSDPSKRIGTALLMSVMAGDKFDISATSYFDSNSTNLQSYADGGSMLNAIVSTLVSGVDGYHQEATNVNAVNGMFTPNNYLGMYEGILDSITDYSKPRAFINYLVFDNQMNLIPAQSGALQISGTPNSWQVIGTSDPISVTQNGYVSIYMSDEQFMPVYMDKLHITHYQGRLMQEQHYYPFGLSINEGTAPGITNQYQYQGKKLQDELGLNLYDFHARQYDAQIGRFWGIDPADQFPSGYTGQGNDPANNIDPTGMTAGSSMGYPHMDAYSEIEASYASSENDETLREFGPDYSNSMTINGCPLVLLLSDHQNEQGEGLHLSLAKMENLGIVNASDEVVYDKVGGNWVVNKNISPSQAIAMEAAYQQSINNTIAAMQNIINDLAFNQNNRPDNNTFAGPGIGDGGKEQDWGENDRRTNGKGNKFRGGPKNNRDGDWGRFPRAFRDWYEKSGVKGKYKLPNQPDPDIDEVYKEWTDLGSPKGPSTFRITPIMTGGHGIEVINPEFILHVSNATNTVINAVGSFLISAGTQVNSYLLFFEY